MLTPIKRPAPAKALVSVLLLSLVLATNALGANKVTTIAVPNGGQPAAAKTDAQGTIHLLFNAADGPQYAKSTDGGKTLSKAIPVVDRESRKPGLEFSVWDLAVSPEGHVHE